MEVRRQMLQEEGQGLVNGCIADHLIIIQQEEKRRGGFLVVRQVMEQGGQDGEQWRRLWRMLHSERQLADAWHTSMQCGDDRGPETGRAIVQLVERQPGNLLLMPTCPVREQGRLPP